MSNAVQLLEEQHAEALALFMKLDRLRDPVTRAQVFRTLDARLRDHAAIEERVFYPAFDERMRGGRTDGLVREARAEHAEMKSMLADLERTRTADSAFDGKLARLRQAVLDHVREEERHMLPQAARIFSESELDGLALRMAQLASLHSAVLEMEGSPA